MEKRKTHARTKVISGEREREKKSFNSMEIEVNSSYGRKQVDWLYVVMYTRTQTHENTLMRTSDNFPKLTIPTGAIKRIIST